MAHIEIRPELPDDYPTVFQINALAFGTDAEAHIVEALRRSDAFVPGLSLVALLDGQMAGHIMFTRLPIISPEGAITESLALAPMAVHPDFQRRGIGSRLVRHGLERARALGFQSVIVLGHPDYYPRFGFVPATKWQIRAPFEVKEQAFMALELTAAALANARGVVRYPDALMGA